MSAKVEHVPDDLPTIVRNTVVASEAQLFEHSEGWCVPLSYSGPKPGVTCFFSGVDYRHGSFCGVAAPMGMLKQLEGQLGFIDRCPPDYQAAVAKDFAIGLPHDNGRHHSVSTLGIDHARNYRSIGLCSRKASSTLSHEVPMPGRVVSRPGPKMQALCLQIGTCT